MRTLRAVILLELGLFGSAFLSPKALVAARDASFHNDALFSSSSSSSPPSQFSSEEANVDRVCLLRITVSC